jgi:HK97 family phage major capsid protein
MIDVKEAKSAEEVRGAILAKFAEHEARMLEMEQKGASYRSGDVHLPSPGQQFVDSEEFKSLATNLHAGRRVSVETKATITSATTDADGSAGDLLTPRRVDPFMLPRRRMTIRSLLNVIPVTSGSVEYAKQTGYTNSAAPVAEGALKPQSELKFDLVQVPIRTIAHWTIASRQVLEDAPQLQALIDGELLYGLDYVEELQILNGDGSGQNLNGLYTQATAFSAGSRVVAAPNKMDVIAAALAQQNATNLPATGVVINPTDWTDMLATKDANNKYILGAPQDGSVTPRLFGVPLHVTEAMAVDKFMVGHFPAATLFSRWEKRVEASSEDATNFRENKITLLAECRVGLALRSPLAMTKGDFSDAITDLTS